MTPARVQPGMQAQVVEDGPGAPVSILEGELDLERLRARLYLRYRDSVYRWALRYGGGRGGWAEDVTHDVFLQLFDRLERLEELDRLEPWLHRVTVNACISRHRRDRLFSIAALGWLFDRSVEARPTPESEAIAADDRTLARAVIDSLPPKERAAFCLHHLDGKPVAEIGAILGHSKGYVSKLIASAEARIEKRSRAWR